MTNWNEVANGILAGDAVSRACAMEALRAPHEEALDLLAAAWRVRRAYFANKVNLHLLNNAKSGGCSENCSFCSQSSQSTGAIPRYPIKTLEEIVHGADEAVRAGAVKYCMVISGRTPTERDLELLCRACTEIKKRHPIHLCVSPGLLTVEEARQLKDAGADRINHNLETSRSFYPRLCTTHTWEDRVETIRNAQQVGLQVCAGGLVGVGENLVDRVDLAFSLRELNVDSIPVNFFNPRPGTPLAGITPIDALDCLRALCMFRFVNPSKDIRAAGGRETNLRRLQPLALFPANSIFTQGYLTTDGQGHAADLEMIEDAGFVIATIEG
ncbi:MAG: biotin synthase BioB [Spartobacteria bacterium]|nr:biotin synthase BioB [Spartobacteria bacterium]